MVIAGVTVSLEGVIGLLLKVCILGLTEVLMELLIDNIGVWLGKAVLRGLITPSIRRQLTLGRDDLSPE